MLNLKSPLVGEAGEYIGVTLGKGLTCSHRGSLLVCKGGASPDPRPRAQGSPPWGGVKLSLHCQGGAGR